MRVVFLTHNYPRRPGDPSGAALGTLARALVRRGISVRVVTPSDESGPVEVDGIPVNRVRAGQSIRETISGSDSIAAALRSPIGWLALARLRRSLRAAARHEITAGADLVHAHGWMPAGLAAPTGTPLVLTVHGTDAPLLKESRIARSLARPLFQRAAVVTTVSARSATWFRPAPADSSTTPTSIPCRPTPAATPGLGAGVAWWSSPGLLPRSGWSSPSRPPPFWPPAATTSR